MILPTRVSWHTRLNAVSGAANAVGVRATPNATNAAAHPQNRAFCLINSATAAGDRLRGTAYL